LAGKGEGERFDFGDANLVKWAKALAPGYLRISGTKADEVVWGETHDLARWKEIAEFADKVGLGLWVGLSAGRVERDEQGKWEGGGVRRLLEYLAAEGIGVEVFELGNEVNAYWLKGLGQVVRGRQLGRDCVAAKKLVNKFFDKAKLVGPASAFWPKWGEGWSVLKGFLEVVGVELDGLSWHYYPTQSRRVPVASKRACVGEVLGGFELDEVKWWAGVVETWRERYVPGVPVWMSETGPAQGGGEPGWSDRFGSSLWWADELGVLASREYAGVVRQCLRGADYGLVGEDGLPNPDYLVSLAWKQLMVGEVMEMETDWEEVRVYRCDKGGKMVWWVVNVGDEACELGLGRGRQRVVEGESLVGKRVRVNGKVVKPEEYLGFLELGVVKGRVVVPGKSWGVGEGV